MPDIRLEILSPNKGVHSVDAPADMKTGDFLADLVEELGLEGTGWRLYNKDLQLDLNPEATLSDNGVRAGHHLYFRKAAPPPPPPPPPAPRWVGMAAAIAALLLGLLGGYILRGRSPEPATQEMREQLAERAKIVAALQAELNNSTKSLDERTQPLRAELAAKTAVVDDLKQQLDRATRDSQASRKRIGALLTQQQELQGQTTGSQTQIKDAQNQAAESKARADQLETQLARANQDLQAARAEIKNLASQGRGGRNTPAPQSTVVGTLVWKGQKRLDKVEIKGRTATEVKGRTSTIGSLLSGALPEASCHIEVGDPDRVEILEIPSQQNGYKLVFRRKDGGDSPTVFFWWLTSPSAVPSLTKKNP